MRRLIGTFATILACVILAGVLLGLYRWNRQNEAEKAAALREKAEQYEQEAVSERNAAESEAAKAVSEAAKAESEAAAPASSAAQAADETVPEEEQAPVTPAAGGAVVISCRGDDFISRSNPGKTYPEYLEEILSAYAEGVTVEDHTWEMAGSLSQLWYAGVPDADLEAYIEKHLEEADSEDELLATDRQLSMRVRKKPMQRPNDGKWFTRELYSAILASASGVPGLMSPMKRMMRSETVDSSGCICTVYVSHAASPASMATMTQRR